MSKRFLPQTVSLTKMASRYEASLVPPQVRLEEPFPTCYIVGFLKTVNLNTAVIRNMIQVRNCLTRPVLAI